MPQTLREVVTPQALRDKPKNGSAGDIGLPV